MTEIIGGLERAAKGDLDVGFPTKRKDEFGMIAKSSEEMLNGMKIIHT